MFNVGYCYVFKNRDEIRQELRGQKVVITEMNDDYFTIKVLTGESLGRTFSQCPIEHLDRDFKVFIKNKGRWIF